MQVQSPQHLAMVQRMQQLPWGWERFFEELAGFLRYIERQEGTANESYAEYVVEA